MSPKLAALLEHAKSVSMTPAQREAQRRSFAYGNTKIENDRITRASIRDAADTLATINEAQDQVARQGLGHATAPAARSAG